MSESKFYYSYGKIKIGEFEGRDIYLEGELTGAEQSALRLSGILLQGMEASGIPMIVHDNQTKDVEE